MKIQLRLIIGILLYLVMVRIENTLGVDSPCTNVKLTANCVNKSLSDIPQDLDMEIENLDMSYNPIKELHEDDFKRYQSLMTLRLHKVIVPNKELILINPNVFAHLKNLEALDISESAFAVHATASEIVWPVKLKRLSVGSPTAGKFKDKDLKLANLYLLEELNASLNDIQNFPQLHPEAPIYWIDLYDNPLKNVTAEHLAPYCLLRHFRIRVTSFGDLNNAPASCTCRRLEQWTLLQKIAGFDVTCFKPPDGKDSCPVKTFSDQMLNQRNACLQRLPTSNFWKWVIGITLLSLTVPAIYVFYAKRNARNETATDDTSEGNGSEPDAATSPEDEDASDSSPDS